MHLLPGSEIFIHQHTDRHSQRLRSHISRHIENQRLKTHDNRQLRDHVLEHPHDGRHDQSQSEQHNQPWHTLFNTVF